MRLRGSSNVDICAEGMVTGAEMNGSEGRALPHVYVRISVFNGRCACCVD
jgi:hypothetical protein